MNYLPGPLCYSGQPIPQRANFASLSGKKKKKAASNCSPKMSLQIVPLISIQCGKSPKIRKKSLKKLKLVHTQVEKRKQEHHSPDGAPQSDQFFTEARWQPEHAGRTLFLSSSSAPDPHASSFTLPAPFPGGRR